RASDRRSSWTAAGHAGRSPKRDRAEREVDHTLNVGRGRHGLPTSVRTGNCPRGLEIDFVPAYIDTSPEPGLDLRADARGGCIVSASATSTGQAASGSGNIVRWPMHAKPALVLA